MSDRTAAAVARAGALDRAQVYLEESKRAAEKAAAELRTVGVYAPLVIVLSVIERAREALRRLAEL